MPGPWAWWLPEDFVLSSWVKSGFWLAEYLVPFEKEDWQDLYTQSRSRYRQLHSGFEMPPPRQDLPWSLALFHHPHSMLVIEAVLLARRGAGSGAWTSGAAHPPRGWLSRGLPGQLWTRHRGGARVVEAMKRSFHRSFSWTAASTGKAPRPQAPRAAWARAWPFCL